MTAQRRTRSWRGIGDGLLFAIGAAGAAWEIFHDHSQNYYIYALIIALLRLGSGVLDKLEAVLRR